MNNSNYTTDLYLYQSVEYIKGIPYDKVGDYKIKGSEVWNEAEINKVISLTKNEDYGKYVSALLYDRECNMEEIGELVKFINSKRAFRFIDEDGEKKFVVLPSHREIGEGLDHYASKLMRVAITYYSWVSSEGDSKREAYNSFASARKSLFLEIAKRLFSKNFKEKYQFKFTGISGVALTGNCSVDGIIIPKWYAEKRGIEIGDIGLVTRDPIQNIVIALRVEGFSDNELRVNAQTYTLLDGDFDGDRVQFIPYSNIASSCKKWGINKDRTLAIKQELKGILPSKIMNDNRFARLVRDYSL